MIELKPCPFCGGEAEYRDGSSTTPYIRCNKCGGRTLSSYNREKLAEAWNKRAAVTDEQFAVAVHDGEVWRKERTCRDFGGEEGTNGEGYDFACSACGFCCDIPQPNYCPNCSAKVMER